jgi:glucose/mannose transport system permease protein
MIKFLKLNIRQGIVPRVTLYAVLICASAFFLLPIYLLLITGLKSFQEVDLSTMWSLPKTIGLGSFLVAIEKLYPNLLNSFYLTIPATFISAFIGAINGFLLSKWKFKGSAIIFPLILFGMFIPYQSILIPLVQFLRAIRLYGTLYGLILTHVVYGLPITTLIFRNYFAEVPDELIEASQIDGCGLYGTFFRVLLPISAPGFVVVIIWQFTNIWNEFLFAVTITPDQAIQPITVALQNLAGSQIVQWNVQMAGALLAALPTLIVYIVLGKFFIQGLLAGSVKG